jgi:oxalate decarboxylase/phosphoglucose isomerase-like protein (cupin superfamily)
MMLLSAFVGFASAVFFFTAPLPILAADQTTDPNLVAKLKTAATMYDRLNMLSDQQLLYNFSANPMYSWKPGSVCNANAATWPVLSTARATVAQLNLGPCAMLAPHIHRANNIVVAVNGSTHTYMVQENGARLVEQVLSPGMMTIFPPASVHSMYNLGRHSL